MLRLPVGVMKPVVAHRRFAIPGLPAAHLARARLVERLSRGKAPDKRVTVVRGGPGTGKTTVLAEYLGTLDRPAAWLTAGFDDADPAVFGRHLAGAIRRCLPDLSDRPEQILASLGGEALPQAISALCDEIAGSGTSPVLMVDDAQHLTAAAGAALQTVIRDFPEDGQVILSGRSMPPLGVARYQIAGQLTQVDESDLAFSPHETARYLALASGIDQEEWAAAQVFERTLGWVAGVVFAAASPRGGPARSLDDPDWLFAYLAEEYLPTLPEPFMRQLVESSLLPRIDEITCRALFGGNSARFMLDLREHKTFVTAGDRVLELQPVFRDFLGRIAASTLAPERRSTIYRTLACEVATSPEERIGFLLAAEGWADAAACLADQTMALCDAGRSATVEVLLGRFPGSWESSPVVKYCRGEQARRHGALGHARSLLADAAGAARGADGQLEGRILASLAAACGALGDLSEQHAHAVAALALLAPVPTGPVAFCHNVLGMFHLRRHDYGAAREQFEQAMVLYREAADLAGQARVMHNLALAAAHGGNLEVAMSSYLESIRLSEAGGLLPMPLTYNNLALCALHLGRQTDGWAAAEQGMTLALRTAARRDRRYLHRTIGRLNLRQSELAAGQAAFEASLGDAVETGDRLCQMQAHLGLAELAMEEDNPAEARLAVERAVAAVSLPLTDPGMIEAATVHAEVLSRLGDHTAAARGIQHVLSLLAGAPDPLQRFYAEAIAWKVFGRSGDAPEAELHRKSVLELAGRHGFALWPIATDAERPTAPGPKAGPEPGLTLVLEPGPSTGSPLAPPPGPPPAPPAHVRASDARAPIAIDVRGLGALEIVVDGERRVWRTGPSKALLVNLMLNPLGVTTERLREWLYPDGEPSRQAIHMLVTRLRQALEPGVGKGAASRFVLFEDGRYHFNQGVHARLDVAEFRQLVRRAREATEPGGRRLELLRRALALYRGPFMAEYSDVPWCQIEQESLRRQMQEAYEELFSIHASLDDWSGLEQAADANLSVDPVAEPALRAKMVSLALQDRPDDALRVVDTVAAELTRNVGGGLEADTQELALLIRDGRLTVRQARSYVVARW